MSTPLVKLVQLTDPHLYADPAGWLRGVQTLAALEVTLAAAATQIQAADAVLATGDLVHDDPGGYTHFRQAFAPLGKPVLCIPGNHDDAPALARALADPPFQVGGQVDIRQWRIILLDSTVPRQDAGCLAPGELAALDSALCGAAAEHALVVLHHHPVAMASQWLDTVGLQNAPEFFAVLDRHPKVRGIVFGHVHQAFETTRRGVRILGTPSTCAQFLPRSPGFAVDTVPPAYRTLALAPDGQIDTQVVWLSPAQREPLLTMAGAAPVKNADPATRRASTSGAEP